MSQPRSIQRVVTGVEQSEGAGARVRRLIGTNSIERFNPFLMFDHFKSNRPDGFPEHPHSGQETITYCLLGAICHEDFTGSKGVLYPGDLQFMTAGKGIVHLEMPVPSTDGQPAELLQFWVDLPRKQKECRPRYRDLREWEVPVYTSDDGLVSVKVISGSLYGVGEAREFTYTPIELYHFTVKPGAEWRQQLTAEYNYFLYVIRGNGLQVSGKPISAFETVFFNDRGDHIVGTATKETEFIIAGGLQLDQKLEIQGPFVTNDKKSMAKKIEAYKTHKGGFEKLNTWTTLISGGVTADMINGPLKGNRDKRNQAKQRYLLRG
ncbi:pirin family protein [Kocuria palustris]|nr:pirin family protein [Kocuria palustris]